MPSSYIPDCSMSSHSVYKWGAGGFVVGSSSEHRQLKSGCLGPLRLALAVTVACGTINSNEKIMEQQQIQ